MTISSLRADAAALPDTVPAIPPEARHEAEALALLAEVVESQTAPDENALSGRNSTVATLLAAAQVEATLAQAIATARLANAATRLADNYRRT